MRKRFPQIFVGWWMVLATGILSGLATGFYMLGLSVIFKPLAFELGLSRAAASVAGGIGILCIGLVLPLGGWLSDRFGPKWVVIAGTCIMGTGLALMNFVTSSWSYYIVWGVIMGTGNGLGFMVAIDTMLTNWFIRKRGLAFGIRFALIGIVLVIVLPIISWLVTMQGWRITCLIWAGVVFAGVPLALYFIKQRRPEYYGLLPDGAKVESDSEAGVDDMIDRGVEYAASFQETEFTLRQAMRTSSYWILTVASIILQVIFQSFNIHSIPFLTDMGIDPIVAGSMMAMMVFFTIPSRFLGGIIADRVGKGNLKFLQVGSFLFMAAGIAAFLLSQTLAVLYVFLILWGLGSGALVPLDILTRGRFFGRKAYGSIYGSSAIFSAPLSFLAPIYVGRVYDVTGSYINAFILFAALAAFAAFIMCLIRVPRPPAHDGDIRRSA